MGKNPISIVFKGARFQVIDLVFNMREETFFKAIEQHDPQILGLSAIAKPTHASFKKNLPQTKDKWPRVSDEAGS